MWHCRGDEISSQVQHHATKLKPDNICFDYLGEVEIFDFGLGKKIQLETEVRPIGFDGSMRYKPPKIYR